MFEGREGVLFLDEFSPVFLQILHVLVLFSSSLPQDLLGSGWFFLRELSDVSLFFRLVGGTEPNHFIQLGPRISGVFVDFV